MKFICASYSKTGTKTLASALRLLGLSVHDLPEHISVNGDYWWRILKADDSDIVAKSPEIFKLMYHNIDAVTDSPAFMFWEQILEAFPDAKVILVERDEDKWLASLQKHLKRERTENKLGWLNLYFPELTKLIFWPLWRNQTRHRTVWKSFLVFFISFTQHFRFFLAWSRFRQFFHIVHRSLFWGMSIGPECPETLNKINPMIAKKKFKEHNAYVKFTCPPEKLLIYKIEDGWDTLCEFIDCPVPEVDFPWANKGGQIISDILQKHPEAIENHRKFFVRSVLFILFVLCVFVFSLRTIQLAYFQ